jgi:hypothetical protein
MVSQSIEVLRFSCSSSNPSSVGYHSRMFRGRRTAAAAMVLCAGLAAAACRNTREPIRVHEGVLHVENQSNRAWRDVTVTMNDYYQAKAAALEPGGQLDAPLGSFMTGFGQRFDRRRESIRRIVVRATTASGEPVELVWVPDPKNLAEQLRSPGKK